MIIDINSAINRLKEKRKIFVSEADFQLELAWIIKEMYPNYSVRLEYCPSFNRKIHIDILVITDKGWIPIELKYKTKGCTIIDNGETFVLANQSAKDVNCYLYLKDIQRIEEIKKEAKLFAEGYTVMLTNEPSYLKKPGRADCVYEEFSIYEGAERTGTLLWGAEASAGTKKGKEKPIVLAGKYQMNWKLYSKINDTPAGSFYYLVNSVNS